MALAATGLALVAGMLPAVDGVVTGGTSVALADDIMASQNANRDGWDQAEPSLSPATVSSSNFSSTPVWNATLPDGGSIYGQPLVIGSNIIVATENDNVYEFNAGTGALENSINLGNPVPILTLGGKFSTCTDLQPNIGVTGTPAYDPATGHLFMFADEMVGGVPQYFFVELNASDLSLVQPQVQITGAPSNKSTGNNFSAKYQMERPGILFDPTSGAVYAAFASHCDIKPYDGYVVRVDPTQTPANYTLWSDESGVTFNEAGIWQSGGGIMTDPTEPGSVYVASGNGVSPTKRAGSSPGGQLAESVIRLTYSTTTKTLSAKDFFSPANAPTLDAGDVDYGAGGPVAVANFTVAGYKAIAQIGKDGRVWLLNSTSLGGREQGTNNTDKSLFVGKAYGGMWGHPAIFGNTNATLSNASTAPVDNDFLVSVGRNDVMRLFRFAVTKTNKPWLTNLANSSLTYGFASGSPVVTSNGSDPTSAVIWEVFAPRNNTNPYSGLNSQLEAYTFGNAIASGGHSSSCSSSAPCTLPNIWHSTTFTSSKFSIPATSQGWVYVGTRDGHLLAWAAQGTPPPAVAAAATLQQTAVGATSSKTVTLTATKSVTITGATASTSGSNALTPLATSEFGVVGQPTVNGATTSYPVHLKKRDKLGVQVSFTPAVPGGSTGTLSLNTTSNSAPTVNVPLTGEGTKQGIYAIVSNWAMDPGPPGTQTFPAAPDQHVIDVPIGIQIPVTVVISNLGTVTQTITRVRPPTGQFSASNLPAVGTQLVPGQSISVQVTYKPTSAGPATGSFAVVGSSGQKAVVHLSGIGTAAVSQLTAGVSTTQIGTANSAVRPGAAATPVTLAFGSVAVGKKVTAYIQVNNSGNTESLLEGVSKLTAPFGAPLTPDVGLPFNPDADLSLPVTFAPTATGTFATQYKLRWRDLNGLHTLVVRITGTGV